MSDGSKCDSANIQEIFAIDNTVALTDPVYPVYCDSNVMAGRTGEADGDGRYAGLVSTCRARWRPGFCRRFPTAASTWCISARRTTRRGR